MLQQIGLHSRRADYISMHPCGSVVATLLSVPAIIKKNRTTGAHGSSTTRRFRERFRGRYLLLPFNKVFPHWTDLVAVDRNDLPGAETRLIGRQEQNGPGDFLGRARAFRQHAGDQAGLAVGSGIDIALPRPDDTGPARRSIPLRASNCLHCLPPPSAGETQIASDQGDHR